MKNLIKTVVLSLSLLFLLQGNVLAQDKYSFSFLITKDYYLGPQLGMPANVDKNSFEFNTRKADESYAYYSFGSIEEYKDVYAAMKVVSRYIPFVYSDTKKYVYVVFKAEKIKDGGYLLRLHDEPVATEVFDKTGAFFFLPTDYATVEECLEEGAMVDNLKKHFDQEVYDLFMSWKQ